MRHKHSQVDHERFIKILEKEKAELEESLTKMEARLILTLRSLRKLERTTWAHSTLLLHKKMAQISHLTLLWCPRLDLNQHAVRHMLLRHTCIPISPLGPVIIISQVYRFYSATSLIAVFNSSINCFETARFSSSLISTQVLPRFSASKAVAIGKPVPLYGSFTFSWLMVP